MIIQLEKDQERYTCDLSNGHDISLGIGTPGPRAWYVHDPVIEPVVAGSFVGSVEQGASVNFYQIDFNPHGHGTHTECVGHVSRERIFLDQRLNQYFFWARLISVEAKAVEVKDEQGQIITDWLIDSRQLNAKADPFSEQALIIRTMGTIKDKETFNYSHFNPPYLTADAGQWLHEQGVEHLLIDLPSVDRENDAGKLQVHHTFWQTQMGNGSTKTITELIFVPDSIPDGLYLLNLQVSSFHNDAAPSRPVLYPVQKL